MEEPHRLYESEQYASVSGMASVATAVAMGLGIALRAFFPYLSIVECVAAAAPLGLTLSAWVVSLDCERRYTSRRPFHDSPCPRRWPLLPATPRRFAGCVAVVSMQTHPTPQCYSRSLTRLPHLDHPSPPVLPVDRPQVRTVHDG
jgi:hypothetical protein